MNSAQDAFFREACGEQAIDVIRQALAKGTSSYFSIDRFDFRVDRTADTVRVVGSPSEAEDVVPIPVFVERLGRVSAAYDARHGTAVQRMGTVAVLLAWAMTIGGFIAFATDLLWPSGGAGRVAAFAYIVVVNGLIVFARWTRRVPKV
ncbi:MAG TPA: hypothetical protein VFZ83_14115 [Acidimicrobiia bacterium]|nr:hypothetical protein [Acidimicrobiia bacterium]